MSRMDTSKNNAVVTVDIVILRNLPGYSTPEVCTIHTNKAAFEGKPALPGGKLDEQDYTTEDTAVREVLEEVQLSLSKDELELLGVFSAKDRDKRFRAVSIAYLCSRVLTWQESQALVPSSDAISLTWLPLTVNLPAMAFDHNEIVNLALQRVFSRKGL